VSCLPERKSCDCQVPREMRGQAGPDYRHIEDEMFAWAEAHLAVAANGLYDAAGFQEAYRGCIWRKWL